MITPENPHGIGFETTQENRTSRNLTYDRIPDVCPICNNGIDSRIISGYRKNEKSRHTQVLFQCPRDSCHSLFIGYYQGSRENYHFTNVRPINFHDKEFSKEILSISESFATIFNEAREAERRGSLQICGAGYRKALEFLIKDYVIHLTDGDEFNKKIQSMWLAKVIREYIPNENIKSVAEKATWLGNDETHYYRVWKDMDNTDLKELIGLTVLWIEMEEKTRIYDERMSLRESTSNTD